MPFHWTKFQDFYLRLGFLKVLTAILDPNRRSVSNDVLIRKLKRTLFQPARIFPEVWTELSERYPSYVRKAEKNNVKRQPALVEALLILGNCPSFLHAITQDTAYKILDWGHNIGLVGRGNQISENALLLRSLFNESKVSQFLAGKVLEWNPFLISRQERVFFLLLLADIDHLTLDIARNLGQLVSKRPIETRHAAKITCEAFFHLLDRSERSVTPHELPGFRTSRHLACKMARELEIQELIARCGSILRAEVPKPRTIKRRRGTDRRTTKNADHQTIPRFEQLVDLGFVDKEEHNSATQDDFFKARKKWRYYPKDACAALAKSDWPGKESSGPWAWRNLARMVKSAGLVPRSSIPNSKPGRLLTAEYSWNAYKRIKRPIGHTPVYSVAALAMIHAVADGIILEMTDVHGLFLEIKRLDLLPNHAFFASGNELDKMFLLLKAGFMEEFESVAFHLEDKKNGL
ncbi:hypothetical protein ACFLU6_02025 [Acidobacteriota bacterium]